MGGKEYGEHTNVHQSHSQNDSGDLRGVAGGHGELGCLCGKAGTSHLCDGSAHSSGCVVNGSNAMAAVFISRHDMKQLILRTLSIMQRCAIFLGNRQLLWNRQQISCCLGFPS